MARLYTRREVARRCRRDDAALVIDNVVYDVTGFLEEHPGGPEVLVDNAGGDASKCFRDVGHGEDAKRWRARFRIGEVVPEERWEVPAERHAAERHAGGRHAAERHAGGRHAGGRHAGEAWGGLVRAAGPPLLAAAVALLVYAYVL